MTTARMSAGRLSPILDEVDPIAQSYTLEVSSPGIGRDLRRPEHFDAFLGADIHVRLIRAGKRGEGFYRSVDLL